MKSLLAILFLVLSIVPNVASNSVSINIGFTVPQIRALCVDEEGFLIKIATNTFSMETESDLKAYYMGQEISLTPDILEQYRKILERYDIVPGIHHFSKEGERISYEP